MKPRQREPGALYRVYTLEEFLAGADARGGGTPMAGTRSLGRGLHRLAGAAALGGAVGAVGGVVALVALQAHPVARATIAPEFIGPRPIARTRAIIRPARPLRRRSPRPRRTRHKSEHLSARLNRATPRRSDLHTHLPATAMAASESAIAVPPASNATHPASIAVTPASNAAPSASIPARTVPAATVQAPVPTQARRAPAETGPPRSPRSEFGFER